VYIFVKEIFLMITMNLKIYYFLLISLFVVSCSDNAVVGRRVVAGSEISYGKPNRITYINPNRVFNDLNDTHLAAAQQIGIEPLASRKGIPSATRQLYLVGGAMRYKEPFVVDELVHSSPFLVKEAKELLHDIGKNFQDSLKSKGLPAYSIIVSSVLRTDADVKSLSRSNVNASKRSVHCYGTTVDISYRRFEKHDDEGPDAREVDLKAVLSEVLRDLKSSGRCYVKYEIKQACFHITARK
jgi:hypothetical protein